MEVIWELSILVFLQLFCRSILFQNKKFLKNSDWLIRFCNKCVLRAKVIINERSKTKIPNIMDNIIF